VTSLTKHNCNHVAFKVYGTVQGRSPLSTDSVTSQAESEAQGDLRELYAETSQGIKDVDRGPRLVHMVKLEKSEIESKEFEGENNFSILR
jgi:hypothetical protein